MKDFLEIHEFFVEGRDQERSHVLLHITEPGTPEERAKGYFFALVEINNGSLEQIEHLQQMIDDLESGYYETEDTPSSRAQAEGEDKNAFELTLEFVNRRGHHILQYKNSVINFLVGVVRGHDIFLSYHGSPEAYLFYPENQELKDMDILGEQEERPGQEQLFSSLLQGTLNDGDYFYLATPHVSDYFTADRVRKILVGRNSRQSAAHIQKVLKELNTDVSFGGLLLHYPDKRELTPSEQKMLSLKTGSVASMDKLIGRETATAEILSSPLSGLMKKKWRGALDRWQENRKNKTLLHTQAKRKKDIANHKHGAVETNFRPRSENNQESLLGNFLVTFGKILVGGAWLCFRFVKKLVIFSSRSAIAIILLATNKDDKRQEVLKAWRRFWLQKIEDWSHLPLVSKIILALTITLGLIFVSSIAAFKINERFEVKKQTYENTVQAILDKKTAADASVLYGDDNKALTFLQEAKELVANLPRGNKAEKNKAAELFADIEGVLMKLRKLENANAELLIDLSAINQNTKADRLAAIDNNLIAFGGGDNNFYKIDPAGKQGEKKEFSGIYHLSTASTPKEQDAIVFASDKNKIAFYNKDSATLSAKDIFFPRDNVNLAALFVYNRRLYALDTNNNQIYRHNPTQTGFDKGADWVKDGTDIKNAVSLALDGDVFVLTKNNLLKFASGAKRDFPLSGLDPSLDNPAQVWTYNNVNNIYILESTNKRVIVLDKTGKLLKQYTSPEWQNPTSMIVQEDKKTIYILDSNKIYKFNI